MAPSTCASASFAAPADPGVEPTLWLRFLSEIFNGEMATIKFLQRAAGYALTGSTEKQAAASARASLEVASELPQGKTWDEATIKDLTGGDRLTAWFMRQDDFAFDPQLTLMIAGNTQPSFRGGDEAIRSRVVLVPFAFTIPAARRELKLPEKLATEGPAILRWCIDGALAWQRDALIVPLSIVQASAAYFDDEDTVAQVFQDETQTDPQAFVAAEELILRFNPLSDRQGLGTWTHVL